MRQSITLQTNDPDVTGGDILGRINFAASNESSGSESQWIGASIYAQASGEFTATVNPTNLVFATSDNNGAIPRLIVSNAGNIFPNAHLSQNLGSATNSFLSFYTATGVISERVKIANVATPPAYALDVSGTGYFSNAVITSGSLIFASGNIAPVGVMQWDSGEGTAALGLKGGNVNLEIGQEQLSLCYNGTGAPITKGKVVYIIGAQGQRPSIALASNSTEVTSSKTLGVVAEDIANGAEGFVATYGIVRNLDTSAFLAGSGLWLDTSGNMTMVRPVQPAHGVHIGYAMHINASSGRIFVRVQNGFEIEELHNVLINSGTLASGDVLAYNSSNGLWQNTQRVAASGSGLTTNYVTKAISSQNIANSQIFDNGTNVGINTNIPEAKFDISAGSILGSGNASAFNITQTWNTTGTPTLIKANVTDTASNANSLLMDLQVGGSSRFSVAKDSTLTSNAGYQIFNTNGMGLFGTPGSADSIYLGKNSSRIYIATGSEQIIFFPTNGNISWSNVSASSSVNTFFNARDLILARDAAGTLAQRNATNAQRFNLYGTYTDASNYRRLYLNSTTAGAFTLGVEGAGTGFSDNVLSIKLNIYDTLSSPTHGSITWETPYAGIVTYKSGQSGQQCKFHIQTAENKYAGFVHYDVANAKGRLFDIFSQPAVAITLSPSETEIIRLDGFGTKAITIADATTIAVGTTTGTKIGTATNQKLGFYNATPVVQQTVTTDLLDSLQALGLIASGAGDTPLNLSSGALTCGRATINTLTVGLGGQTSVATNTTVGFEALNSASLTGENNVGVGYRVLLNNTTGASNVAAGYRALLQNTTGGANIAVGFEALINNTTGGSNAAIGSNALRNNTTGGNNNAMGSEALRSNTTGTLNSALGNYALYANTTGTDNSAVGYASLFSNTTGIGNTAIGRESLFLNTTGFYNKAIGAFALYSNTTGAYNFSAGFQSLSLNTTGNYNIVIGHQAGDNITTGSSNIIIGAAIDAPSATASNQINIGGQYFHNQLYLFNSGTPGAANYERGKLEWSSNVFRIGTEKAGTGSARALELQTDGTTRLTIGTTGNVGIGTSSPSVPLQVNGTIRCATPNGTSATLSLFQQGAAGWNLTIPANDGPLIFNDDSSGSNVERMRITSAGNVGIGTTSPDFRTVVAADVTETIDIDPGSAHLSLQGATAPTKRMVLGYDTSAGAGNGFGFIKAGNYGVTWTNLALQPDGGNVGIGTHTPNFKTVIQSDVTKTGDIDGFSAHISLQGATNPNKRMILGYDTSAGTGSGFGFIKAGIFQTGYTNLFLQPDGGNVGIGTTTANRQFVLNSNSLACLALQNSTTGNNSGDGFQVQLSGLDGYIWNYEAGPTIFGTSNAERMRITADGNLGIGTTSPGANLQVNRTGAGIAGYIYQTGSTGQAYLNFGNATTGLYTQTTFATPGGLLVGIDTDATAILWQGSNYALRFGTNSAERMRITSAGNVGIGTPSPYSTLEISPSNASWGEGIVINPSSSGYSGIFFRLTGTSGSTSTGTWSIGKNTSTAAGGEYLNVIKQGLTTGTAFRNDASQQWLTNGNSIFGFNVGIGTTSPQARLDVAAADVNNVIGAGAASINITNTNESSFDRTMNLIFSTGTGTLPTNRIAAISALYTNFNTSRGGALVFATDNGSSYFAERMRITSSGNVGIGTTTPNALFNVSGGSVMARFQSGSATDGRIEFAYNTTDIGYINMGSTSLLDITARSGVGLAFGSNATERMRITSGGNVGIGTTSPGSRLQIDTGTNTTIGLIVKGAASQSANLTEWQNSAGSNLALINSAGNLVATSYLKLSGSSPYVGPNTSDGSDNAMFYILGGGDYGPATRGGHIGLYGLESATRPGNIELHAGLNAQIVMGGEQGGGMVTSLVVKSNGSVGTRADAWHYSIQDDLQRSYLASNSTTYLKGHGSRPFIFRNGADTDLVYIESNGEVKARSLVISNNYTTHSSAPTNGARILGRVEIGTTPSSTYPLEVNGYIRSYIGSATDTGWITHNSAAQWVGMVNAGGVFEITKYLPDYIRRFWIEPDGYVNSQNNRFSSSATNIASVTIRGITSQTDRLISFRDPSFVELAYVDPAGNAGFTGSVGVGTSSPGAKLQIDAGTNTTKGLIVKAAASQTATLTEWQNSAGTILSSVNNVGVASFAAFASGLFNCDVEVSGHLQARTKSFVVDHPTQPGAKLHYGSLESPYHGIRLTGSGVAVSGYCTVNLPDYIGAFVHSQDINIQLTPINHFNAICVHSVDAPHNNFVVSCNSYEHSAFYWDFTAVRKDVDRIQVESYDGHIL